MDNEVEKKGERFHVLATGAAFIGCIFIYDSFATHRLCAHQQDENNNPFLCMSKDCSLGDLLSGFADTTYPDLGPVFWKIWKDCDVKF